MDIGDTNQIIITENWRSKFSNIFGKIVTIEPVVLLFFFAFNLSGAILKNEIIFQTCSTIFNYNISECKLLGTNQATKRSEAIETEVQPYAAKILMAQMILESVIPAIGSLSVGSWSDKFGRKPIIHAALLGYLTVYVIYAILAFFTKYYTITPWAYVIALLPVTISGGISSLITGSYSYIADISTSKNKATRLAFIEVSIFSGGLIGSLGCSYLFQATSTLVVFIISSLVMFLVMVYTKFCLKESLTEGEFDKGFKARLKELFSFDIIKDMFKVYFKERLNYDRAIVWLAISTLGLYIFTIDGNTMVFFLFVREKFDWTVQQYTIYSSVTTIFQIAGMIFALVILRKIFKFSVTGLSLIGLGGATLSVVVQATAVYSWHLYLASFFSIFLGVIGPMCRAILSDIVSKNEIGKIFALATFFEGISPLVSSPLYTFVYSSTLSYYPGAFNWMSTGFYLICFTFISIIFGIEKSFSSSAYEAIIS